MDLLQRLDLIQQLVSVRLYLCPILESKAHRTEVGKGTWVWDEEEEEQAGTHKYR